MMMTKLFFATCVLLVAIGQRNDHGVVDSFIVVQRSRSSRRTMSDFHPLGYRQKAEMQEDEDDTPLQQRNSIYLSCVDDQAGVLLSDLGGRVGQQQQHQSPNITFTSRSIEMADRSHWMVATMNNNNNNHDQQSWPTCCSVVDCSYLPKRLATVALKGHKYAFSICLCERCFMDIDNELSVQIIMTGEQQNSTTTSPAENATSKSSSSSTATNRLKTATWHYPIQLRANTVCLSSGRLLKMPPLKQQQNQKDVSTTHHSQEQMHNSFSSSS
jgi:hypothetical protein